MSESTPPTAEQSGAADTPGSPSAPHGSGRSRRIVASVISAALTRPLAILFQLVTVRLLLRYLGREQYGVYETVISMAVWISLSNAGLSQGLLNNLIDCYVSGDRVRARRWVASTTGPLILIVATLSIALWVSVPWIPWPALFRGLSSAAEGELPQAVRIAGLATLATVLATIPAAIYSAYQETHLNNLWDAAGRVLAILACVLVVRSPFGLGGAFFAVAAVPAIVRLMNVGWLFAREKPWLRPRRGDFSAELFWPSLRTGAVFFALQTGVVALTQTDRTLVSAICGPGEAADYAVVLRVFLLAYGAFAMIYVPLWPAHGEALRRGDLAWVRRTVQLSILAAIVAAVGCGGAMLFAGAKILRLWLGAEVHVPASLVVAFTLSFVLRAWIDCRSVVLNPANVLRPQLWFFAANAAIQILLAVLLGRRYGSVGIAWAGPLAAALTTAWGYPWMLRRTLMTGITPAAAPPIEEPA